MGIRRAYGAAPVARGPDWLRRGRLLTLLPASSQASGCSPVSSFHPREAALKAVRERYWAGVGALWRGGALAGAGQSGS